MYSNHEFESKLYVVGRPNPNHVNDFYIRILLELEVKSESKDFCHGRTVEKKKSKAKISKLKFEELSKRKKGLLQHFR